ncbi:MAG TPA: glycosyltransferase [Pyrinomonadaceae bacterium]
MRQTVKLLAVIEATTVTGPAKNLLAFCRRARADEPLGEGLPRVETTVVTFERAGANDNAAPNDFVKAARDAGLETEVLRERFRFDTRVVGELRRVVERRAPDVLQTHMVKSHFFAKLSGLGKRLPWVAYHHGYTTTDLKMRAYNQLNRWSLPSAARVVTVCGPFAEQLARTGVDSKRIRVLHNSVVAPAPPPAEEVLAVRARLGLKEDEKVLLAVGRLSREKGHADLVRAVARLRETGPDVDFKLVILGEGPERAAVEEEARRLGVFERIVFAGHASDVRPFYALADALALPSHSEGSPNVLLEAMAAGVPVAATRVGGVPEIASNEETALLVPAHAPDALAEAFGRLLSDAQTARALAARAREHVLAHFSPEAYARALVGIYGELVPDALARVETSAHAVGS